MRFWVKALPVITWLRNNEANTYDVDDISCGLSATIRSTLST